MWNRRFLHIIIFTFVHFSEFMHGKGRGAVGWLSGVGRVAE
jgi:hypothetical protein